MVRKMVIRESCKRNCMKLLDITIVADGQMGRGCDHTGCTGKWLMLKATI